MSEGRLRPYIIRQGDTLRGIALREYADPTRWIEIAHINGLRAPYVVNSHRAEDRLTATVIWGDRIKLITSTMNQMPAPEAEIFGRDFTMQSGVFQVTATGDLALVSGFDNIREALIRRIKTLRGELVYYQDYGCHVTMALGLKLTPIINLMASAWVHDALKREPRLGSVNHVQSTAEGDAIRVDANVSLSGENSPVDLNLVVP